MKVIVIGSGTCIIRKQRRGPSFYVETNQGVKALFDCGWGCTDGLLKANIDIQNLDHIFISHSHADHIGNLLSILQSIYVTGTHEPDLNRKKPLFLHGYDGFRKDYETLRKIMFPERLEKYPVEVLEYVNSEKQVEELKITSVVVKHVPEYFSSVAFRIDEKVNSFVYSGDSAYDEALAKLSKNADFALFDASISVKRYTEFGPGRTHMSAIECGLIAQKAKVKKLALFHLYDNSTDQEITEAVRQNYSGELIITQDLQEIEV